MEKKIARKLNSTPAAVKIQIIRTGKCRSGKCRCNVYQRTKYGWACIAEDMPYNAALRIIENYYDVRAKIQI